MQLLPEQLALLVNDAVRCVAGESAEVANQRSDARYPTRQRVKLYKHDDAVPPKPIAEAVLVDLSNSGAQLVSPRALSEGRTVLLELRRPGRPAVLVPMLIRRQARLLPRVYELGGEFLFHLGGVCLTPPNASTQACEHDDTVRCPLCQHRIKPDVPENTPAINTAS
ncbi:MAG: PilZ domain-containing protein [Planctomycetota bacterium]